MFRPKSCVSANQPGITPRVSWGDRAVMEEVEKGVAFSLVDAAGTGNCSNSTGFGTSGGVAQRINAQLTPSKKGPRIRSLAAKLTTGDSGNLSGCPTTLNSVARFPEPLNGVLPNKSSYRKIPNVHQSTALPWPSPLIISGAKYSCVPTNDMDRALLGSAISSGRGETWLPISVFGFLLFLDLLEKRRGEKQVVVTAQDG
nr:Isocitrate dehydrogenase [NADP] [Ipomoea batatas]